jgi:hypothetical protein
MRAVEVSVCDWLFRALVADHSILTYNWRYFELTPLEKRLYEIARSGPREGFRIGLGKLYLRVGCRMDLKHFKAEIAKFAGRKKSVPDYAISIVDPRLRRSLDRTAPPPPGRTPLKSLMVAFFPTTGLRSLAPIDSLPLVEDEAPPRAPIMQ